MQSATLIQNEIRKVLDTFFQNPGRVW